jgi:hypothetical protein
MSQTLWKGLGRGCPLLAAVALAVLVAAGSRGLAAEREVGVEGRSDLVVTVYNRNLGLIGETRRIALQTGENVLALSEVSPSLRPETLLLEGAGVRLLEQSLRFDLLTPRRLLEKSVGGTVWVVRTHPETGEETLIEAELLSVAEGPVVRIGGRVESVPADRLAFAAVPEGLRPRPTLIARLESEAAGEHDLRIQYLTAGLTWQADYLAEVNAEEDRLDLTGLVTLSNTSGVDFPDARLRLVAGVVNQAGAPIAMRGAVTMMAEAAAPAPAGLAAQAIGEQHLYEVERPVTLADREIKQIVLLRAHGVSVSKEFRFEALVNLQGGAEEIGPLQADVVLRFENVAGVGPGKPLPGGVVRVYQPGGADGAPVFIGEDRIGHTPEGEEVRLAIARAFDVTGRAKRTALERLSSKSYETAQEIVVANAKDQAVQVKLVGHMPPGWRMLEESAAHEQETANRIAWTLTVPAGGKTTLSYRARVTRP